MSLVVALVGLIAYGRLTVREYPKIDEPVVTVDTTFKGASSDIIESQVTQILEESLSGIEGIDYMSSISRQEKSQITFASGSTATPMPPPTTCATASAGCAPCPTRSTSR